MSDSTKTAQESTIDAFKGEDGARKSARNLGPRVYLRALTYDKLAFAALVILSLMIVSAVFAPFVSPHSPTDQSLALRNSPPMTASEDGGFPHLLGTDALGRDVLARLIYGARISLTVGALSVLVSGVAGVILGLLSGYYRGIVDDIIMRIVDVQMGFPSLLLALVALYALGPSVLNVILVLAFTRWTIYARIARGITMSLRQNVYIDAARAIGCNDRRILLRHMLPNMLAPLLVLGVLEAASIILAEASLSFLGLGIQPPDSSWGLMLAEGRQFIRTAWWLVMFPGLAILLTALSLNLLASWSRSVTDPVQRWRFLRPRRAASGSED